MTVAELIEKLSNLKPEAIIVDSALNKIDIALSVTIFDDNGSKDFLVCLYKMDD